MEEGPPALSVGISKKGNDISGLYIFGDPQPFIGVSCRVPGKGGIFELYHIVIDIT
jgi:hypothetical protein